MSNKTQIFLSYKDSDAFVADKVAERLESVLPEAVSVWNFKKKLRSGKVWRQEISYHIGQADWFILLILDPLAKLDWCLYEAGQFIGKWEEEEPDTEKGGQEVTYRLQRQRRLTCLSGIDQSRIPSQLSDLQHVHARTSDIRPVEDFLRQIVLGEDAEERHDLFRQYWNEYSGAHIKEVANELCTLIENATIARTDSCRYLDIVLPPEFPQALPADSAGVPVKAGDSQSDDFFSHALVLGEEQSLTELFGSDPVPNLKALERVAKNHRPAQWFNELSTFLRDPNSDYPVYTPFTDSRNKARYQPLLYRVDKRKAGETVYRILFYKTKGEGPRYVPVSTFHELMDNLVEQLEQEKDEPTYFMAYTPALGFLALQETQWGKLREAMIGNAKEIRLICPQEDDIKAFHQEFMGQKTDRSENIDQKLINSANQAAEQLIKDVKSVGGRVTRLPKSSLPSYYLFFGRKWGIIAVPFFQQDGSDTPAVEMLGLLTTNQNAIKLYLKVFEAIR